MLPHLVRFTSSSMSASEMIPLPLQAVKWFFTKLGKVDKFDCINHFDAPLASSHHLPFAGTKPL
jgi:hypothetical protein